MPLVIKHDNANHENVVPSQGAKSLKPVLQGYKGIAAKVVTRRPALSEMTNRNPPNKAATAEPLKKAVLKDTITVIKKDSVRIGTQVSVSSKVAITTAVQKQVAISRQENILSQLVKPIRDIQVGGCVKTTAPHVAPVGESYSSKQLGVYDVDAGSDDPALVTIYIKDIMMYLIELEGRYVIEEGYLKTHRTTPKMRSVLVNWLVEVHQNFKFLPETFHLAVALVDRYLQLATGVGRETLQLVGTVAMWIAVKYEEMHLPDISEFVYICDDTFSKQQIIRMEVDILKRLKFELGRPLSIHFLRRYNKVSKATTEMHSLGKYLLELALLDYNMCHVSPSMQAAAACYLSLAIFRDSTDTAVNSANSVNSSGNSVNANSVSPPVGTALWTKSLIHYTTYHYASIRPTVCHLAHLLTSIETSKYQAVRCKYASSAYGKISASARLRGAVVRRLAAAASAAAVVDK